MPREREREREREMMMMTLYYKDIALSTGGLVYRRERERERDWSRSKTDEERYESVLAHLSAN